MWLGRKGGKVYDGCEAGKGSILGWAGREVESCVKRFSYAPSFLPPANFVSWRVSVTQLTAYIFYRMTIIRLERKINDKHENIYLK